MTRPGARTGPSGAASRPGRRAGACWRRPGRCWPRAAMPARRSPPSAAQAGARAVAAAPGQADQMRLFAADVSARLERVGPVLEALAAAPDPELAELRANVDRDRLAGMRTFVAALERRGPLQVDAEAAAETVWALA